MATISRVALLGFFLLAITSVALLLAFPIVVSRSLCCINRISGRPRARSADLGRQGVLPPADQAAQRLVRTTFAPRRMLKSCAPC